MSFQATALNIICFSLLVATLAFFISNKRLENDIFRLLSDVENLRNKLEGIHQTCPDKVVSAFPRIPATHIVAHNEDELNGLDVEVNVTFILLYKTARENCLRTQVNSIKDSFPKAKILCATVGQDRDTIKADLGLKVVGAFKTKAEAINVAVQSVVTTYFLLLQPDVIIEPKSSDNSIEWLHHAMVRTPGLDIIGGSRLLSNKELVIDCYSINFCNWTMSQYYEYRRSFGEVMICEEISYSFMARVEILKKFTNDLFDVNLDGFLYTDFFLRAKRVGLTTASRPEVMFVQTASCLNSDRTLTKIMDAAVPFSKKHNILRFKDLQNVYKSVCDGSDKSLCSEENMIRNWKLPKWYESGTFAYPFTIEKAIKTLEIITSQLQKADILFALRGETLLGAMMTNSVLPWGRLEAVQLWVYLAKDKLTNFARLNNHKYKIKDDTITMMVKLPEFPTSSMVEIVLKSSIEKESFVNIQMNGKLYPINQDPILELKGLYGKDYLLGGAKAEKFSCKLDEHHACLPDMVARGATTYREKFCEI